MSELPEKFGKYHILQQVGKGSMGIVYTGYDPFTDSDVAIKACRASGGDKANQIARKMFFNEAHMAGVLNHPNIVKILDAGEEDGAPYLVMEFVDGGRTLLPHTEISQLLPVEQVVEHVCKCARALDYAHRRGVIHRDIKPSNLMLSQDGDVKIGDFGIAQRGMDDDTTHVMGLIGSPRYMSPEQVQEEFVSGRTDIYSLGVVMFELLTGKVPFSGSSLTRLIHQIINDPPPSLLDLRPDLPPGVVHIVEQAMHKNPDQRFQSGAEFAAALVAEFSTLDLAGDELGEEEKFKATRELSFFNDFSDSELWEVLFVSHWETHAPGETVVTEGTTDFAFYVMIAGEAQVLKNGAQMATLGAGQCFGEIGYLSRVKRGASIHALDQVRLLRISESVMEQLSDSCQLRFTHVFLRKLVERLADKSDDLSPSVNAPATTEATQQMAVGSH